jgi:zinc protease
MRLLLAAVALLPLPLAAAAQEGTTPAPERPGAATGGGEAISTFTLDNGLTGVVIEDHRAPVVTQMLWYRVGAADEPPGKSGLAHFLEHLMFKATDELGDGDFSKIVAANGGQDNAFTSYDYTGYFQRIAADRLETVMAMEADRMADLDPGREGVLSEREVVREERRQVVENDPGGPFREQMQAALYLNHPYGRPIVGWPQEMAAFSYEDAMAFYRAHYAPNNAILIIAGDISAEEVRPLAEKFYGPIPASPVPERTRIAEPPQFAPRTVTLESPRVAQPSVSISYLAPSYNSAESDYAYPLQVLDEILGGGTTSRLYRALVVEQAIAASAGSSYDATAFDLSTFRFYVSPRPGLDMAKAEEALRAEIARVLENGVTDEEVARAKERMVAEAVYARDSLTAAPYIFGQALTSGRTVEDVEAWPDRIAAVTAEQVTAAARAVLRDVQSVTGVLLPAPTT